MPELQEALRLIEMGHFSNGDSELFRPLLDNLTGNDPFFVMADFADYLRAQEAVSLAWTDRMHWNRMSLLNTARTGFFSSDRSIGEYCREHLERGSPQRRNHLRRALMSDLVSGDQPWQLQP